MLAVPLWIWKILSFILSFLGAFGESMIDKIEAPKLSLEPFTDLREWVYDNVTTGQPPQYFGGTVTPWEVHTPSKSHEPRYFIHLRVKNETKFRGKNSTAKRVYGKLTFYRLKEDVVILPEIYGRWAESIQPPMTLDKDALKYIDILPGDTKTLDLVTRYPIHKDWYAVSTESYTADQFENSMLLVKEPDFRLKVELNAENTEVTRWYVVYNQYNDGKPRAFELKE